MLNIKLTKQKIKMNNLLFKRLADRLNLIPMLFLAIILTSAFTACQNNSEKPVSKKTTGIAISEDAFLAVPDSAKPWVYYWWLKGNVSKELITRDLEEMHNKGIGGLLLFDSRGYHDDYYNGHIPVPLHIKYEFMSPEWREMVKFTMQEANRLGLKISINLANTGGLLRGPWDMGEDGPKQLIWTSAKIEGPMKISVKLKEAADKNYFQDVSLVAVPVESIQEFTTGNLQEKLNENWKASRDEKLTMTGNIVNLKNKINGNTLQWDVPDGKWIVLRFGQHVIGETGSVDILNSGAVEKYFKLMGDELLKDAGPLAGTTLTHFYNVSWEGGQPDWTTGFENDFKKFRGYDLQPYMPMLAGIVDEDTMKYKRFIHDYLRTVSDCFTTNCYENIGNLCHARGIQWHSENGGPWPRNAPMFQEADQLTFWGSNDMPQGEFWCSDMNDLHTKSNVRYTAMSGHIYGQPIIAVEAFTHMGAHWTKYPAYLKPFADVNFIDGANFFIWHTFTASPLELGKPGFEYFAGTHINPNVTWFKESRAFFTYLGRCQYLLRQGKFTADVCSYVSNKNYTKWGRGETWNSKSSLSLGNGYSYDLINAEMLVNRMSVENGRLVLPDGMSYNLLVVDLEEPAIPLEVLEKIKKLAQDGATVVLGSLKPTNTPGIFNFPQSDDEVSRLTNELWGNGGEKPQTRKFGKGTIYTGTSVDKILKGKDILPDFEGPFEYIHRSDAMQDIYFVSGKGKAECVFRVNDKKPEIWNPVTGKIADAVNYRLTDDGRVTVLIELPENGSVFIVFRKTTEKNHIVSFNGPENPEILSLGENPVRIQLWESGDYNFNTFGGNEKMISVAVDSPIELTGAWNVSFELEGKNSIKSTFNKLMPWNEHSDPFIKYFSGTASYEKTFSITEEQVKHPMRLQLGKVHDICRVWLNGKDLGVIWTAPWQIELTNEIKEGTNDLKIEVTNCWSNRLIGDAGLPPANRTTNTNVRLVTDRSKYSRASQAVSATDPLMPSGLLGPVSIEFGKEYAVEL